MTNSQDSEEEKAAKNYAAARMGALEDDFQSVGAMIMKAAYKRGWEAGIEWERKRVKALPTEGGVVAQQKAHLHALDIMSKLTERKE